MVFHIVKFISALFIKLYNLCYLTVNIFSSEYSIFKEIKPDESQDNNVNQKLIHYYFIKILRPIFHAESILMQYFIKNYHRMTFRMNLLRFKGKIFCIKNFGSVYMILVSV